MDNNITLLLVEDSLAEQELIREALSSSLSSSFFDGYHVDTAVRLAEALAYLRDHAADLVVLDLNLPDSDGLASLAAIREQAPDLPVIVLTVNDDVAMGKEAMRLGAQDFLAKGSGAEAMLPRICFYALERHRAQQKAQAAENLLRTLLDALPLRIVLLDGNMQVVWANDRALKESSRDHHEEILGRPCREIWQNHGSCHDCPARKALKTGEIEVYTDTISQDQTVRISGCPVVDHNGHIYQVIAITEDISERRSLERQLRQAQKMESLGTLAGGIAHDFNNILTAILGFTELGRRRVGADSALADDLEEIQKAGMRARDLVHQILTFSRQVEQEIVPLDLSRVIREALKLLRASLPSSIQLTHDIPVNLGMVAADPTQIHQVVMNLCTNAAHAMAGSAGELSVTLAAKHLSREDLVLYHDIVAGLYLEFTVSDTGRGIPPEDLQVIFDPYFTTKEVGEGTGLGLAVVHGIVRDCGGCIEVASVVGQGTTFTILLPASSGLEKEPTEDEHIAEAAGRGESILVVDDEPAILKVVRRLLEGRGYKVDTCKDPRRAQIKIQQSPKDCDLLLSDVVMPNIMGDRLAVEARRAARDLPVILMSGNIDKLTLSRELGDDVVLLKKPLDSNILLKTVRELLDGPDSR
ncbi:MAG: response regulator [Desulfopila sp.]